LIHLRHAGRAHDAAAVRCPADLLAELRWRFGHDAVTCRDQTFGLDAGMMRVESGSVSNHLGEIT
jgi:hypothetical protein